MLVEALLESVRAAVYMRRSKLYLVDAHTLEHSRNTRMLTFTKVMLYFTEQ
jgi:hypothetical protein